MTPIAEMADSRERAGRREHKDRQREARGADDTVIVLPEPPPTTRAVASTVEILTEEFAGMIPPDVVERATAAARHVLERSRIPATPEAVERLARDQLRARLSPSVPRHRRH